MDHHAIHLHHHLLENLNPLELAGFVSILSFSFFASLHCAAMCVPLVAAHMGRRASCRQSGIWLYNSARTLSYTGAGFILGWLSAGSFQLNQTFGRTLAILLGLILINQALVLLFPVWEARWQRMLSRLPGGLQNLTSSPMRRLQSLPPAARDIALGLLTVLLPCMTLTPALTMAAASGSGPSGAITMLAFALGTWPAMTFASGMPNLILSNLGEKAPRRLGAIFLLVAGFITIFRSIHH